MKNGITHGIDWKLVGAQLANLGDEEQADFFKAFIKECNGWGTRYQVESQFAAINAKLTDEEREQFSMIGYTGE